MIGRACGSVDLWTCGNLPVALWTAVHTHAQSWKQAGSKLETMYARPRGAVAQKVADKARAM